MNIFLQFLRSVLTVAFLVFVVNYSEAAKQSAAYTDSEKVFQEKISKKTKTYVVFGADWCGPCRELKLLLKQAEIADKIIFLNASKLWVIQILTKLKYQMIPFTVVYQNGKPTGVVRAGMNESLIFLIANVDS